MLFVAILAAVVCTAWSASSSCVVSDWGEWSECKLRQGCTKTGFSTSFPVSDEVKAEGKGRKSMAKLVGLKKKAHDERQHCKSTNTCPQQYPPKSVTAAIVPCVDGFADIYPCNNVDMLSFLSIADLGYSQGNVEGSDLWVWHDPETLDDYVIMGLTHGTSFVRVTDPVNPEVVGIMPTKSSNAYWRDMKVIGDYAYIVADVTNHGMQIFDMKRLRGMGSDNTRVFEEDFFYDRISNTHNIAANIATNKLFLVGSTWGTGDLCEGGLHIVDVTNPMSPYLVNCYGGDGYVHDTQCMIYENGPDARFNGKEICFCYNEDTFTIVDITDNDRIVMLSRVGYTTASYTHQGWVSEDLTMAIMNDEGDEYDFGPNTKTYVWNITNLEEPVLVETFESPETSIDHNLYIRGNYVHQSNYEAGYRLLTLDTQTAPHLSEVAYFDVRPDRTTVDFYGSWSNYPYFDDESAPAYNAVAVSSIDYGLFMLKPNYAAINSKKGVQGESSRYRQALYGKEGADCPSLVEKKKCLPHESC